MRGYNKEKTLMRFAYQGYLNSSYIRQSLLLCHSCESRNPGSLDKRSASRRKKYHWLVIAVSMLFTTVSYAFNWPDILLTRDQQGATLLQKQQYPEAAERFNDPLWKGVAYYRAGNYKAALSQFEQQDSVLAYYNKGNSLAKLGQYIDAIEAYKEVLKKDSTHVDAQYNKALLEDLLKRQKKQNQDQSQNQNQSNNTNNNSETSENQQNQNKSQANEQQQNKPSSQHQSKNSQSDERDKQNKSNSETESQSDAQKENQAQKKNNAENEKKKQEQPQSSSATARKENSAPDDQQLKQIPDDPGELLKQKILRDHLLKQNKNGNYPVNY